MTCIIGVVCEDGIVLVSDTKVKAGEMVQYEKKIIPVDNQKNLVVAAAGFIDVREKFMQDMKNLLLLLQGGIIKKDPSRGFVGLTEDIAHRLWEIYAPRYKARGCDYESEAFAAFVCHKPDVGQPYLYHIDSVGNSSRVKSYEVLGTGAHYAHLFLRYSFHETAHMHGMAMIATFIILLIQKCEIDESIGIEEGGTVQVWMFPNNGDPYEVLDPELTSIMKEARDRLDKITYFLVLGKTRL